MVEGAGSGSERAARLGREVRRRLADLRLSGRQLADAGYISRATLQRLTGGTAVPRDLTGLERALGWQPGSAHRVAAGGEPTVMLVPRDQAGTVPGAAIIDWPRPDENWKTAIEEAWARLDRQNDDQNPLAGSTRTDAQQQIEQAIDSWLAPRSADLPVWLAERLRGTLIEATRSRLAGRQTDPLALADRIMALDHARTVLALLIEWARQNP